MHFSLKEQSSNDLPSGIVKFELHIFNDFITLEKQYHLIPE